jgi:hypothetical protein
VALDDVINVLPHAAQRDELADLDRAAADRACAAPPCFHDTLSDVAPLRRRYPHTAHPVDGRDVRSLLAPAAAEVAPVAASMRGEPVGPLALVIRHPAAPADRLTSRQSGRPLSGTV